MPKYVDGFMLPIPKKNLAAYRRLAALCGKVWREHGALEFRECAGDDLQMKCGTPIPRALKLKRGETAMFSWITFKSRAHRDRVNDRVMKDPRLAKAMDLAALPFDAKRMLYGGFTAIVDL